MPCGAVSENEWCFGKRSETADTTLIKPWGSWQTWTSGQVWSSMSGEIVCYGKCRLMMPLLVFGNFPRCASTMCDMYWHWSSPPWWGTCTSAVTQQISSGVSGMMPVYLHMETATPSAIKFRILFPFSPFEFLTQRRKNDTDVVLWPQRQGISGEILNLWLVTHPNVHCGF